MLDSNIVRFQVAALVGIPINEADTAIQVRVNGHGGGSITLPTEHGRKLDLSMIPGLSLKRPPYVKGGYRKMVIEFWVTDAGVAFSDEAAARVREIQKQE